MPALRHYCGLVFMLHTLVFLWQICHLHVFEQGSNVNTLVSELRRELRTGQEVCEVSDQCAASSLRQHASSVAFRCTSLNFWVHTYKIKRGLGAIVKAKCLYLCKCECTWALTALICRPLHQFCQRWGRTAWHEFPHQNPKNAFPAD